MEPAVPQVNNELEWYICYLLNHCHKCKTSLHNNIQNVVRDQMENIVMEEETLCKTCGVRVDYYATGSSENDYYRDSFEMENPKATQIIKSWGLK